MPGGGGYPPMPVGGGGGGFPNMPFGFGGAPPPPPPPRPAQKRWLPPPAWTPGATGGITYRQWLWQLSGWNRITGMSAEEKGVAVALSLGGRAGRIAQAMPPALLNQRNGLHSLLIRLETELGSELQDRVRSAARQFQGIVGAETLRHQSS